MAAVYVYSAAVKTIKRRDGDVNDLFMQTVCKLCPPNTTKTGSSSNGTNCKNTSQFIQPIFGGKAEIPLGELFIS